MEKRQLTSRTMNVKSVQVSPNLGHIGPYPLNSAKAGN